MNTEPNQTPAETPTQNDGARDALTQSKIASVKARGFRKVGETFDSPDGKETCIVWGPAVRWLDRDEMFLVMHPPCTTEAQRLGYVSADLAARDALIEELREALHYRLNYNPHIQDDAKHRALLARTPADAGAELVRLTKERDALMTRKDRLVKECVENKAEADALRAQLATAEARVRELEAWQKPHKEAVLDLTRDKLALEARLRTVTKAAEKVLEICQTLTRAEAHREEHEQPSSWPMRNPALVAGLKELANSLRDAARSGDLPSAEPALTLKPTFAPMKFADTVRRYQDGDGERFVFTDRTGHVHGEYRRGCVVSPAPESAVGAVKIGEAWFWVLQTGELPSAVTLHVWIPAIEQAIECLSRDDCPAGLRGDAAGRLEALREALQSKPGDLPPTQPQPTGYVMRNNGLIGPGFREWKEPVYGAGDLPTHPDTERLDCTLTGFDMTARTLEVQLPGPLPRWKLGMPVVIAARAQAGKEGV